MTEWVSVYSKSPQIWFRDLRSDFESYGLISRATVWFRVLRYRFRVLRSNFETYGLSSRPWYIFLDRSSRIRDMRSRIRDLRCHFETYGLISRFWPVWPPILALFVSSSRSVCLLSSHVCLLFSRYLSYLTAHCLLSSHVCLLFSRYLSYLTAHCPRADPGGGGFMGSGPPLFLGADPLPFVFQ